MDINIFNQYLPLLTIVGMAFLFLGQYRQGKAQSSTELITLLQNRDKAQQELITDYQKKFEEFNHKLGLLQGQIEEKDKKIEEYMQIFQGRNPAQEQYMTDMREFTKGVAVYMKDSAIILDQTKIFMQNLNLRTDSIEKRNKAIDNATEHEDGKLLRKKA